MRPEDIKEGTWYIGGVYRNKRYVEFLYEKVPGMINSYEVQYIKELGINHPKWISLKAFADWAIEEVTE